MRTWCIKFGVVFVLHFNHSIEAFAGEQQVSTDQYLSTLILALKYENELNCQEKKVNFINSS
jgi:hypothetical protein